MSSSLLCSRHADNCNDLFVPFLLSTLPPHHHPQMPPLFLYITPLPQSPPPIPPNPSRELRLGFLYKLLVSVMEGGHTKDTKASSDDVDSLVQVNEDAATGRFYECIFCKRGFSTAQALGGHMNIHRKDRARMRQNPEPIVSRKAEEESLSHGYHHQLYPGHQSFYPPVSESLRNYPIYFPASTSGARAMRVYSDNDVSSRRSRELCLFDEDLQLGLGVHIDGLHVKNKEKREEEDDELDLELRLGNEP